MIATISFCLRVPRWSLPLYVVKMSCQVVSYNSKRQSIPAQRAAHLSFTPSLATPKCHPPSLTFHCHHAIHLPPLHEVGAAEVCPGRVNAGDGQNDLVSGVQQPPVGGGGGTAHDLDVGDRDASGDGDGEDLGRAQQPRGCGRRRHVVEVEEEHEREGLGVTTRTPPWTDVVCAGHCTQPLNR